MTGRNGEFYQVNKIVGEKEVQVVERAACAAVTCPGTPCRIIQVLVEVSATADTIFTGKVVTEGVFTVQILYANGDGFVRHAATEIPFMVETALPGVHSGMNVENKLIQLEEHTRIVQGPHHDDKEHCQIFDIKVHARFLIRVTESVIQHSTSCERRRRRDCTSSTRSCNCS